MNSILEYEPNPEEDYYSILGCDELSETEQIITEYKVKARECHPDKHPDNPQAAKQFALLQQAKETLTDPDKRSQYDCWRRSGIAIPYQDWCARKDCIKTSMHWAVKEKKEPMIEAAPSSGQQCSSTASQKSYGSNWIRDDWQSDTPNDIIRKFRNYEI